MADDWEFRKTHEYVSSHAGVLNKVALDAQRRHSTDLRVPLLAKAGWIPSGPLPLASLRLRWHHQPGAADAITLQDARAAASAYWPSVHDAPDLPTYHGATEQHLRPGALFNGLSYRLLAIETEGDQFTLDMCPGRYFDLLDTSEPLAYETALLHRRKHPNPTDGEYRRWLADPFSFTRRCVIPGVNTLTIVRYDDGPRFIMHRRGDVATARGTTHVIPAGEFQPHNSASITSDLDIWRNIMREYAEEVGGKTFSERDEMIDYESDEPCATLQRHRAEGSGLRVSFLGTGLYPLTWKAEILTVCVLDEDVFRLAFPELRSSNAEGDLILSDPHRPAMGNMKGLVFDEETVGRLRDSDDSLPAARACLELAWRWRSELAIFA